ncbi:hypothetical protein [Actinomycetospora soli]|uniref:hypothetical protein n=1 Tax=Actinomycetospora soli TaxID=2893887 RepID=UPI001E30245F|nr:hypothetical protein [Actinomycetospora soli]MCD2186057.1 hypothetical protein [Actinomycetospora soli]
MVSTGRRAVVEPGEPAGDLAERLGLHRPERERAFVATLRRVRDAELRAEYESDGIRLR